jgi:hypothetical protein
MEFIGDYNDLLFGCERVKDKYVIKFQGDILSFYIEEYDDEGRNHFEQQFFDNYKKALKILEGHILSNFYEGHYWHASKNNTFSKEGGLLRNGGNVENNEIYFLEKTKELVPWLLENKIFTIEKF